MMVGEGILNQPKSSLSLEDMVQIIDKVWYDSACEMHLNNFHDKSNIRYMYKFNLQLVVNYLVRMPSWHYWIAQSIDFFFLS